MVNWAFQRGGFLERITGVPLSPGPTPRLWLLLPYLKSKEGDINCLL